MLWLLRIGSWMLFKIRFYYWLSGKYQRMQLTWAGRGPGLPVLRNLFHLEDMLSVMRWREDGIYQWFDTIEHPKAVWIKQVTQAKEGVGDCDDIAYFAVDRVTDLISRQVDTGEVKLLKAHLLSVVYREEEGKKKVGGHNVCAISYVDNDGNLRWAHCGNWYSGKIQWGFCSLWAMVLSIAGRRSLIQWALADDKLRLVSHGWTEKHAR